MKQGLACTNEKASLWVQERWLTHNLAAVNRTRTPWVLVNFHNPWYTTDYSFKVRRLSSSRFAMRFASLRAVPCVH